MGVYKMTFYLKLIKPVAEDTWCGQGCRPQKDIVLEDIWYLEDEEEKLTEKYEKVVYDTYCRTLNFQMKTISIPLEEMEHFLYDYEKYKRSKLGLLNRKKEDCPSSCLKDWERREERIKEFEEKYFTQTF